TFLPNTSFRGPEHLWVRWDPERNPERRDPGVLGRVVSFPIGAPSKQDTGRRMRVAAIEPVAEGIVRLTLDDPRGRPLPRWTPGAHIDLQVGGYSRRYSLCGRRGDSG